MAGGSTGSSGLDQPATKGEDYQDHTFNEANNAELVSPVIETGSIALRADPDNSGIIYLGWDDQVTVDNGFPLEAGDVFSSDLDVNEQGVYAVADTVDDSLRIISTN